MPDFDIADQEFDRQATILETLVKTIDISARQDGLTSHVIAGDQLPIIPAGGQNTMAAAAVVLLAAHFEEYVRQQVEEYASGVMTEYIHLEDEFRQRLMDVYWRAGASRLNRISPRVDPLWAAAAGSLLRGLISYPVEENVSEFTANILSVHENNMRWEVVTELAGRIGIRRLSDSLFKDRKLKNCLATARKDDFAITLRRKLGDFYSLRNGIVHSISQNQGIAANVFGEWAEFFRIFTTAFAKVLSDKFREFTAEIAKKKVAVP